MHEREDVGPVSNPLAGRTERTSLGMACYAALMRARLRLGAIAHAARSGARPALLVIVVLHAGVARAGTLDSLRTHALGFAVQQLAATVTEVGDSTRFPRSTLADGSWMTTDAHSWTSGFFPGCLWLLAEHTGDDLWVERARSWTAGVEGEKDDTSTHDVGFKILCSFGNGYRLTGDTTYADVVRRGAQSLATRYSIVVGCTRSWNNYTFPVIIDNMMNLEILLWGASHGGNPAWQDMAVSHGLRTRTEHVRPGGSTYHLVDFDPGTGAVLDRITVQGYSDESTWARGQAWGLYGFTMAYRETGDPRFLETAAALADWFINHLPPDHVPYWDFDAPGIPAEEKDTSAAAIACSGLLELSTLATEAMARAQYFAAASDILAALCSPGYLAEGTPSHGILLHGVGYHPANSEVDVSLIYGDYYFLEALLRYPRVASDVRPRAGEPSLLTAHPNPGRVSVEIRFELPNATPVELRVLDARGRVVRTVAAGCFGPGSQRVAWDGRRDDGRAAPSGTYFCELHSGATSRVCKLTWLR